jgi:predicted nucleotidyltransferase
MELGQAIEALCDAGVEFVVIGGVAAALHGGAIVTFDLDIFYFRDDLNLQRLVNALAPFHPRLRGVPGELPFVWDKATLRNASILTLATDLGDIDLLAEVGGVGSYQDAKATSISVRAYGRRFQVLDLRSLIRAKRAAGRDKDLRSLPELESLLEAQELNEDRTANES